MEMGLYKEYVCNVSNNNHWDYAGLYMKCPFLALASVRYFLSLGGVPQLVGIWRCGQSSASYAEKED